MWYSSIVGAAVPAENEERCVTCMPSLNADNNVPGAHIATRRLDDASPCVSIVSAVDGARFAAVAPDAEGCLVQVASYVADHASAQLWPSSARRVHELLAAGDPSAAVAEYFQHAGERWEAEWLVTVRLEPTSRSSAWAGMVPLSDHFTPPQRSSDDGLEPAHV